MSRRTIVLTVALAAMVAIPAVAPAQGGFGGPGRGHHGPAGHFGPGGPDLGFWVERIGARIDLTEDQEAQIEAILEASRPAIERASEALRAGRDEWQASHEPGEFDEAAFRAHLAAQSELHADLMVAIHAAKAQVFGVLTPEQREELESMRECMGKRMGGRHGGPRRGR